MPEYLLMLKTFTRELGAGFVVVLAAFLLSRILRRLINKLRDTQNLSAAMAIRLQSARQRVIVLVTALVLMQALGIFDNAWAFISAGIAAVALGFVAAWSILSNATAALLIMTFRPFRIGDTLELLDHSGAPMGGRVLDMNLMYTTLGVPPNEDDTPSDRRVMRVPNNLCFQRVLRLRTSHLHDSTATFFAEPKDPNPGPAHDAGLPRP